MWWEHVLLSWVGRVMMNKPHILSLDCSIHIPELILFKNVD
jgi:hypothetical protein